MQNDNINELIASFYERAWNEYRKLTIADLKAEADVLAWPIERPKPIDPLKYWQTPEGDLEWQIRGNIARHILRLKVLRRDIPTFQQVIAEVGQPDSKGAQAIVEIIKREFWQNLSLEAIHNKLNQPLQQLDRDRWIIQNVCDLQDAGLTKDAAMRQTVDDLKQIAGSRGWYPVEFEQVRNIMRQMDG